MKFSKIIGYVGVSTVRYSEVNHSAHVSGTEVTLYGLNSIDEAIEKCKTNLKNFREVKNNG